MKRPEFFDFDQDRGQPDELQPFVGRKVIAAYSAAGRVVVWLDEGHCLIFQRVPGVGLGAMTVSVGEVKRDAPSPDKLICEVDPEAQSIPELIGQPFIVMVRSLIVFGDYAIDLQIDRINVLGKGNALLKYPGAAS